MLHSQLAADAERATATAIKVIPGNRDALNLIDDAFHRVEDLTVIMSRI